MLEKKIFITSACRTAVGSLGKTLKNVKAEELGSAVISNAIYKSNTTMNTQIKGQQGYKKDEMFDKINEAKNMYDQFKWIIK